MTRSFAATCTVLGGANGSGKSTIFGQLGADGEFVNADLVARQIAPSDPTAASFRAGKLVLARLIEARQNFGWFIVGLPRPQQTVTSAGRGGAAIARMGGE
jgi:predicted ABC-type ATPase